MTASSTIDPLNSRFLEGLAKHEGESILAAATPQRFDANSVVTNQGQPADHLFLLTKGRARFFLHHRTRPKTYSSLASFWRDIRGSHALAGAIFVSCQHRNSEGELGVDVGSQ